MLRSALLGTLLISITSTVGAQIPRVEYAARRAALATRMHDGVMLVLGAREPKHDYLSFEQAESFRYFTGFDEPDAALVMVKQGARIDATLFVEGRDPTREVWTGLRRGVEGATAESGIATRPIADLRKALDSLGATATRLYVIGESAAGESDDAGVLDLPLVRQMKNGRAALEVVDASPIAALLRGTKSAAEMDLIRKSAEITAEAHRAVGTLIEPGTNEFEVQALVEYTFRRNGANRPSFASIVGSGASATTLHYNRNDRFMRAGDLVVIDIGASYRGYAADVTRTYPVSGVFTREQREVYQIVRDAQATAERNATLGAEARLMSDSAAAVLANGLARLGLIESPTATYDCDGRQCPQLGLYYMHALGHGIGLEVHDPDQFYFTGIIAPGSAFTIEPGIYVRANTADLLERTPRNARIAAKLRPAIARYANIGVRIEDDYVATSAGVEWISRAPRELAEIEMLMRQPFAGVTARDSTKVEWYRTTEPRE